MPAMSLAGGAGAAINAADKAALNAVTTADDADTIFYKMLKKGRDDMKNMI
jgi:hypothetical protein